MFSAGNVLLLAIRNCRCSFRLLLLLLLLLLVSSHVLLAFVDAAALVVRIVVCRLLLGCSCGTSLSFH